MGKTTIGRSNIGRPAPRWYRIAKKLVYGLFSTVLFTSTLQRFGVSDKDVTIISGWLIAGIETLGSVLANSEDYTTPKEQNEQG